MSLHRFAARLAVLGAAQRFPHAKEMGMSTMEPPDCHGAPDEHKAMTPTSMVVHGDLASTLFQRSAIECAYSNVMSSI